MPLAARNLRNDDAVPAVKFGRNQGENSAIHLTINEIVEIPGLSLVSPLVEDPAPCKLFGKQILQFPIRRFPKFSLVDIAADNDVPLYRLPIAFLHVIHKPLGCFERGFVDEVIVVAQRR